MAQAGYRAAAWAAAISIVVGAHGARADTHSGAHHWFDGTGIDGTWGGLKQLYIGVGGQASRLGHSTLTNDGPCGDGAMFDCPDPITGFAGSGTHALLDSQWGGGFRVELGWHLPWLRVFTQFQANYWRDAGGPVAGGNPGDFGSFRFDMEAYTLTFGVGFDSAVLMPTLLPPGWNLGVQASAGPTWNHLGRLHASGSQGGDFVAFEVAGGTHQTLAVELAAFLEYALSSRATARLGYASKWLGEFRGHGGVETVTINGMPEPDEVVGGVTTGRMHVNEIFFMLTFRPN